MKPDSEVKQLVVAELEREACRGEETAIAVGVRHGIVTLDGIVASYDQKRAIEDAAHRVPDVIDVASELRVQPRLLSRRSNTEIAEMVRRTLALTELVPSERIQTTVTANGHVTLRGTVTNVVERELAESAIRDLDGVELVTNYIAVEGPAISESFVLDSIRQALARHLVHDLARLSIDVRGDTVVVSGSVDSLPERRAVVGAIKGIRGVKQIDDRLCVETPASAR